jgi:hypothetical protein
MDANEDMHGTTAKLLRVMMVELGHIDALE